MYYTEETNKNPNILSSILARLTEYDLMLKQVRECYYKNAKILIELEVAKKEEIEKQTIRDLEEIENLVYYKFQLLINELKTTQQKYKEENIKLISGVQYLKDERNKLKADIKDASNRLEQIKAKIGDTYNFQSY